MSATPLVRRRSLPACRAAALGDEVGHGERALVAVQPSAGRGCRWKFCFDVVQQHAVLRALGAGKRRLDVAQVQLQRRGVVGLRRAGFVPQALCLGVGLDQRDLRRRCGRTGAGRSAIRRRSGRCRRSRRIRAPCWRWSRGRPAAGAAGRRRRIPRTCPTTPSLRSICGDGQHQVGGGGAFGQRAGELEAHHLRNQHRGRAGRASRPRPRCRPRPSPARRCR